MTDLAPIADRADAPEHLDLPEVDGLTWRTLAREDVPAYTSLVQATQEADGLEFRLSQDEAEEIFAMPAVDVSTDSLLGVDEGGVPRAWTVVYSFEGDQSLVRAVVDGGVHPAWRGKGIGSQLVAWGTGRARQVLASSGKDVPGRICQYLDDTQEAAARLFRTAGYHPVRYYAELRRPLDDTLPPVTGASGVRIEPWPVLDEEVRLAHNAAFADHWGSQPRSAEDWAASRSMFAPRWSFIAREESSAKVVGYVWVDRFEHDWEIAGYSSGYIHLLGVLAEWRGRGLAKALLAATMHAQREDGIEFAEIGVDTANPSGAHGMYTALGFTAFRSETMLSLEI